MSASTAARTRKRGRHAARKVADDYLRMVRAFPLSPLRNDRDYEAAAEILDRLAVRPEGTLTPGEQDYLDTLTLLVQAYDAERFKAKTANMKPVEVLIYLMEQSGMSNVELGRLLGNRPLVTLIKQGQRGLSKTHIRILSEHFKVEPSLFLER